MNPCQHHTDTELVALLMTGDKTAFACIYQTHARELINYVRKTVTMKEDAEEIVQEIFVSLWSRRKELSNVNAIRPYLFSMVRYKIVSYIRHSTVRKKFESHYRFFSVLSTEINIEMVDIDVEALIAENIPKLPERCQAAFRLRVQEDLSYKDIAEKMNISISAVEKHISAALRHLRSAYRDALRISQRL